MRTCRQHKSAKRAIPKLVFLRYYTIIIYSFHTSRSLLKRVTVNFSRRKRIVTAPVRHPSSEAENRTRRNRSNTRTGRGKKRGRIIKEHIYLARCT